ncbi:unnamed protein product, partial [Mesorhabditis spiculigera]
MASQKHWIPFNLFLNVRYRRSEQNFRPLTPRERVEVVTLLLNSNLRCRMTQKELTQPQIRWDTCPVDVQAHSSKVFLQGPRRTQEMPSSMGVPLDVYYRLFHEFDTQCSYDPVIRSAGYNYPQDAVEICIC